MWERGPTGDHGQDGKTGLEGVRGERGPAGQRGERGTPGTSGPDEFERMVAQAFAQALTEEADRRKMEDRRWRRWMFNRQMLVTYLLVAFCFALLFFTLDRQFETFRRASVANCQNNNAGNAKVNTLLDQLAVNALTNTARLPQERKEIASTYRGLRLPISKCPP